MHGRSMRMEARYATRKQQLLAECQIAPAIFEQVLPRLTTFMAPFVETFCRPELGQHAHTGFDHGVGHSLLLLYDAKISHGENINYFNGLDLFSLHYPCKFILDHYKICYLYKHLIFLLFL